MILMLHCYIRSGLVSCFRRACQTAKLKRLVVQDSRKTWVSPGQPMKCSSRQPVLIHIYPIDRHAQRRTVEKDDGFCRNSAWGTSPAGSSKSCRPVTAPAGLLPAAWSPPEAAAATAWPGTACLRPCCAAQPRCFVVWTPVLLLAALGLSAGWDQALHCSGFGYLHHALLENVQKAQPNAADSAVQTETLVCAVYCRVQH